MKKALLTVFLLVALALTSVPIFAQPTEDSTYVNMVGQVDSYGAGPAYGWLGARAKVGEWAKVHVFWMPSQIPGMVPGMNFTYSFYAANLVNTSMVELNYTGKDFYVNGTWDVYNVTWVYYDHHNFNLTIEALVEEAPGELSVTGNWTDFTVAITGIELISGTVKHYSIRSFEIPVGDVNFDGAVDIYDLVSVAKAHGCTPGMGRFGFDLDLNFDFHVDIYDLVTVANDFGMEY